MTRTILAALLTASLAILAMPPAALAKSPTVKLTISGGGLPATIEVTDPAILSLSNAWTSRFLDFSREAIEEHAESGARYEISLYVQGTDGTPVKVYVFYYCRDSSGDSGYIYLPGRGEAWYQRNIRTIYRQSLHGKWSYASREWEKLMKPVIAHAEEPHTSAP